ncbi:MAG: hypothetical protein MUF58_15005 [Arcicella sp.]|jgi:hypothetical protein|nr:hypothetical protein [Arcicella sp.]
MEKNEKGSIKYDAFVKAVRPDPKSTEQTVYLEGFIGESSLPDHFRLYTDASLNDFVEIPTNAVVHSIANTKEESALGGSKLWVKKDAIYTYGNPAMTNRPQGSFLEGDLYQGYMDSMYQPDANAGGMGVMGGVSQPITGCIGGPVLTIASKPIICKKSLLTPCITKPWQPICNFITKPIICQIQRTILGCPPVTTTIGPIKSIADCPSFPCPTPTFRPGEVINPAVGGGMSDFSGGGFNPYFDGDLYQGYMDNMYQPDANAAAMGNQGGMENMASQPITGCIQPTVITINPACTIQITRTIRNCPPRITLPWATCPPQFTRWNFPPCNRITLSPPCFTIPGGGTIRSIAGCPSLACNPGGGLPFNDAGQSTDFSGGGFNPYFDGDLYQGYMNNMYQPDANAAAMGNQGGIENMASLPLCSPIPPPTSPIRCLTTLTSPACNIRSRVVVCRTFGSPICPTLEFSVSRCVACVPSRTFPCITRDRRASVCNICIPEDWTRFRTFPDPSPVFNPGRINVGGGQLGGDFYGAFDPYSGY